MLLVTTNVSSLREMPNALQKAKRNPFSSQYASLEEQYINLRLQCTFADTYLQETDNSFVFLTVILGIRLYCVSLVVILPLP